MGVEFGQIFLLNGAQSFGRSGVATQDDELATHLKKLDDGLPRELINHLERAGAIGSTRVVAQIDVVVLRQELPNAVEDG